MEQDTVLNEKYRLIGLIGQGGMGAVWRAQHLGLDSPVAVKVMTPEMAANPEAVARFTREARAAASLRSPHVVQILDYGVDPVRNEPFIVMELLEGESLSARIKKRGQLSPAETARVIQQVSRALTLAHAAKIVHRDLKPDNIFMVRNADDEIVKVLDFGIAKSGQALGGHAQTVTGSVLGTPYYMSPEQITNSKGVDQRSDLWSLSVIACECLTGHRPFVSDTAMSLAVMICQGQGEKPSNLGAVPAGFDDWFARGTSLDRQQRFQSASELSESLQSLFERGPAVVAEPFGVAATLHAPLSAQAAAPVAQSARFEPVAATTATRSAGVVVEAASVGPLSHTANRGAGSTAFSSKPRANWLTPAIAAAAALAAGSAVWFISRGSPDETPEFEVLPSPAASGAAPQPAAPRIELAPSPAPAATVALPVPAAQDAPSPPKVEPIATPPEPVPSTARPVRAVQSKAPAKAKQSARVTAPPKPVRTEPPKASEPAPKKPFDPYNAL